jgi:rare lipoprotein A
MGGNKSRARRALAATVLAGLGALAASRGATATDLETARTRAQSVADDITSLEQDLAGLRSETKAIKDEIADASRDIGLYESDIHDAEAAYSKALDRYVTRAVEIYKAGPSGRLELILSADSMADLYTLTEAAQRAADVDADALEELLAARDAAQSAQDRLDDRKQRLMTASAKKLALEDEVALKLADREAAFDELNAEIEELEAKARRQARLEAAESGYPFVPGDVPGGTGYGVHPDDRYEGTGPANGVPEGFASTGISFEGEASWYGPGFEGNATANGDIFDSSLYTAASKELPLGSYLLVTHEGRGVVVYVNDRGPYAGNRVLDLSHASAQAIGISGVGWVRAEVLIKKS